MPPMDMSDVAFLSNLSDDGGCTTPAAVYSGLAITQQTTSFCYRKPILTATSVSHSLADDTNLRFWVNCKLTSDTLSTFGAPACSSGSDLVAGMLFTYAQLQAGINLLYYDSTNAAAQDASDDIAVGWHIEVTACSILDCATSICADSPAQTLGAIETFPYDGAAVYDGSTYPSFLDSSMMFGVIPSAGTYDYELTIDASIHYYADSSSSGDDAISANSFKVHFQYDLSCDDLMGCSSYTWIDGDESDSFLPAGDTGPSNYTTFIMDERDCWDVDYIWMRYRVEAIGSCGTSLFTDWSMPSYESVTSAGSTARCNSGNPPPP
jgi:hypothetical protein